MLSDFMSYPMGAISNQGDDTSQLNEFFTLPKSEGVIRLDRSFQDEEEEEEWEDEEEWDEEEEEDWEEEEEEDWEEEEEWDEEEEEEE